MESKSLGWWNGFSYGKNLSGCRSLNDSPRRNLLNLPGNIDVSRGTPGDSDRSVKLKRETTYDKEGEGKRLHLGLPREII